MNNHRVLIYLFVLLLGSSFCYSQTILTTNFPTPPPRSLQPEPRNIVVANAYDVKTTSARENKEKLLTELIDITVRHTSNEINRTTKIPATFIEGQVIPSSQPDSLVQQLMLAQNASHAIIIKSFNTYFEQTDLVVRTDNTGSKNREAHYDIIVTVGYTLHNWSGRKFDTLISARKYHSSRNVLSGLLAAGPNIVMNSSDAIDGIYANVDMYLKSFFKGSESRKRMILITSELKELNPLIKSQEYEKALEFCKNFINSSNMNLGAKAAYNCAVLLEYMERYSEVKQYLLESQKRYYLIDADVMLDDYRMYRSQQ